MPSKLTRIKAQVHRWRTLVLRRKKIRKGIRRAMSYTQPEKWVEIRKGGDFAAIGEKYGISPVIARILRNREIVSDEEIHDFLFGTLEDMENPMLLDSAPEAAGLLYKKVRAGCRIRIIGDYDVDGICSTYILYDTLSRDGADVDYDIPDRLKDGFGLNVRLIEKAHQDGVDTILTCDNGIAATDAVSKAKEYGMTIILTDHHEPNYEEADPGADPKTDPASGSESAKIYILPPADLIVNPKKPGCTYPNKDLCGAGVAWKLMHIYESLYMGSDASDRLNETDLLCEAGSDEKGRQSTGNRLDIKKLSDCPVSMEHLPFAAIATVADVMKLTGENRILVQKGLSMLPDIPNPGMQALIRQTGISGRPLNCYDIGFILGPCLNAGGRLDSAMRSVALLTQQDPVEAIRTATELAELNAERKNMTEDGRREAARQIESTDSCLKPLLSDRILVVYLPGIHEAVAGIIASRIKDDYNRPTIILTDSEDPDILKGSGRSIEAWNMFEGLTAISDVFVKFGGHAMAAGVSLRKERLDEFRRRINENCTLTEEDLIKKVKIDMRLPLSYITEDFVSSLKSLEPFGPGNRAPLFAQSGLRVLQMRVLGQKRNAVKFLLEDGGTRMEALWFGDASVMEEFIRKKAGEEALARIRLGTENDLRLAITYHPDINEFRGVRNVQVRIVNYQ